MFSVKNIFNKFIKNKFSFTTKMVFTTVGAYSLYQFNKFSYSKLLLEEEYQKMLLTDCENLQEGQMKEFKYADGKNQSILIVKYDGKLRALSNYCPHFGAPMHQGVLVDKVVKCPYHGASFDVTSGKTDISPSINDLTTFEVVEENGKYYVKLPKDLSKLQNSKVPEMAKRNLKNKTRYVIVGAGGAGMSAAETLRQSGFTGEIVMISEEEHLPYDRTMLTKWVPPTVDKITLRNKQFFDDNGIEIRNNTSAKKVDSKNKKIELSDGTSINYDKVLIATGTSAQLPNVEGVDKAKDNLYLIRTYNDAKKIMDNCGNKKDILIVGGSFISMEAASLIKKANKAANVTVLVRGSSPFNKELGKEVGSILKTLHEENGVKIITDNEIKEVNSNNGHVNSLRLKDDTSINCDMLVFGTGVKPNTELLEGLVTLDRGYVKSNLFLNTSNPDIFCAGDIASIPFIHTGSRYHYGHWVNAQQQGAISALNMLDRNVVYDYVPYYWTRMWDKSLSYTGVDTAFDEVFVEGDPSKYQFVAYYFHNNKVVGCASMGIPNATNIMYEAFKANIIPRASAIKNGSVTLDTIKQTVGKTKNRCSRSTCACSMKSSNNSKI